MTNLEIVREYFPDAYHFVSSTLKTDVYVLDKANTYIIEWGQWVYCISRQC